MKQLKKVLAMTLTVCLVSSFATELSAGYAVADNSTQVCIVDAVKNHEKVQTDETQIITEAYDDGMSTIDSTAEKSEDSIVIKLKNKPGENVPDYLKKLGIISLNELTESWYDATVESGTDVKELRKKLSKIPQIVASDYNYAMKLCDIPDAADNEGMNEQWYLDHCGIKDAWSYLDEQNMTGGSPEIVVAVVDSGVDVNHKNLKDNIWTNKGEIPGNGIDDDNNGYIDDVNGANVANCNNQSDVSDTHGHGTHVSGIIAAETGCNGSVGIAYNVKIMPVKIAEPNAAIYDKSIIEGVRYAAKMGADVINLSIGGTSFSIAAQEALQEASETSVIVAAAGNESNEIINSGVPSYPGALDYVLGVMASDENDTITFFSNSDYVNTNDAHQYEIMAPGLKIYSTLPGDKYDKWSGTSMASPVVAAAAALLRTKYSDKTKYSSAFIKNQLVGTAQEATVLVDHDGESVMKLPVLMNVYKALTEEPVPDISVNKVYMYDGTELSVKNNGNGVVEAGETIQIGVDVYNKIGTAKNITVSLDSDTYNGDKSRFIKWVNSEVDYSNIGAHASVDNGIVFNDNGSVKSITQPFEFVIAEDAYDKALESINIKVVSSMKDSSGEDKEYKSSDTVKLMIYNRNELPDVIDKDFTVKDGEEYYVDRPVTIKNGAKLTVESGGTLYFSYLEQYGTNKSYCCGSIISEGELEIKGTPKNPVYLKDAATGIASSIYIKGEGTADISYADIENPDIEADSIEHCNFTQNFHEIIYTVTKSSSGTYIVKYIEPYVKADEIRYCSFNELGYSSYDDEYRLIVEGDMYCNQFCSCAIWAEFDDNVIKDNVFLNNFSADWLSPNDRSYLTSNIYISDSKDNEIKNNSFINPFTYGDNTTWLIIRTQMFNEYDADISENYWGAANERDIDAMITDEKDNPYLKKMIYRPILNEADSGCYPFVTDVSVYDEDGNKVNTVGKEKITVEVSFNRDMDTDIAPKVSYGTAFPYNEVVLDGNWKNSRTWIAMYDVNDNNYSGKQYFRIKGACAESDMRLVTGDDFERYGFAINKNEDTSMKLTTKGSKGTIILNMLQRTYKEIKGYNIYRRNDDTDEYTKINSTPVLENVYVDKSIEDGIKYHYYYTAVKNNGSETEKSNVSTVSWSDCESPYIEHQNVYETKTGEDLKISAIITDNIKVEKATLYYKILGKSTYDSIEMTKDTDSYSVVINEEYVTLSGLQYYIEATDGKNTSHVGSAIKPIYVKVYDKNNIVCSPDIVNGVLTTDISSAYKGDKVNVSVKVDDGYILTDLSYVTDEGTIAIDNNSFIMPDDDVVIKAVIEKLTQENCPHTDTKWIVDKNASYDNDGSKHEECCICHKSLKTETINKMAKTALASSDITLSKTSYTYNSKACKPTIAVKHNSKTLTLGVDYSVSYKNYINAGTATVTITGKNAYSGNFTKKYTVNKANQSITGFASEMTVTYGDKSKSLNAKAKGKLTYKSSAPSVVAVNSKGTLTYKAAGVATITVTAVATTNYKSASKKIKVTVKPEKSSITSIQSSSKGNITLKWKKVNEATGYVVKYKLSNGATKSVTIKSASQTQTTIKKLPSKKTYTVTITAFKEYSNKRIYSTASASKTVKVK